MHRYNFTQAEAIQINASSVNELPVQWNNRIACGLSTKPNCPIISGMNKKCRAVRLRRNELLVVNQDSDIFAVHVVEGKIWLTATPGDEDVLIGASQYYPFTARWPFVLQALMDSDCVFVR